MFFHLLYLDVSVDEMASNRKPRKLELDTELIAFCKICGQSLFGPPEPLKISAVLPSLIVKLCPFSFQMS